VNESLLELSLPEATTTPLSLDTGLANSGSFTVPRGVVIVVASSPSFLCKMVWMPGLTCDTVAAFQHEPSLVRGAIRNPKCEI